MAVKVGDEVTCFTCGGAGYVRSWAGFGTRFCYVCDGTGTEKIKPANPFTPLWDPGYIC